MFQVKGYTRTLCLAGLVDEPSNTQDKLLRKLALVLEAAELGTRGILA